MIHNLAAVPVFLGLPAAAFTCSWQSVRAGHRGFGLYCAATATTILATTALAGAGFNQAPRLVNLAGLFQRASIVAGFGWLTAPPRRDRLAAQVSDVPLDEEHLADVRERQILRRGQHLDGAGGDPAVALIGGSMGDRHLTPGQRVEAPNRARRFSFTGSTNSPPCSWMWRAVAFTVCSASQSRSCYPGRSGRGPPWPSAPRSSSCRPRPAPRLPRRQRPARHGREQSDLVPVSVLRAPDRLATQLHLHQRRLEVLIAGIPARRGRGGEPIRASAHPRACRLRPQTVNLNRPLRPSTARITPHESAC